MRATPFQWVGCMMRHKKSHGKRVKFGLQEVDGFSRMFLCVCVCVCVFGVKACNSLVELQQCLE